MRRAVATVSLSGTLHAKLEAAAAAGFDAVELFEADFINHRGSAAELRAIADDLGLGIDLYQPFRDFEGMPEAQFRRNLDRAEHKFDLMQTLGAPLMLVCSNTSPQSQGGAELAAEQLHTLAERAAQRGLRIGFEALAWGRWVKLWREAWAIVERAAHPNLGLILDSFHTLSLRDDPAGIAQLPGEKIYFVQMADAPLLAMDVLQWARHHRNFPGQGDFDCEGFFEQALRAGYAGTLSLEIFNDIFRATPNRRTALDAMRSLLFLESRVRERLDATGDAGRVLQRVALFDPPKPPRFDGIAFLEFNVDQDAADAMGAWLGRFGFVRHGTHRTKAATLYRQGDLRLVVNTEQTSARADRRGSEIGTIGLYASDPGQAADRASALLSARADSPRGAGELALPAVVAPGGLLLQFVPTGQRLDGDFVDAGHADSGAGLLRIDHLAMGLANDRLDTWRLFARSVLGLRAGTSLELADPNGLVTSAGFANDERTLRWVLNVSSSDRTRAARQLSAAGASGVTVHHAAFACDDIFATAETLRRRGVRFVPISANYYDDLVARLALDEALVRRMQRCDILYDAAPHAGGVARYFHAYSEAYDGRFFFEIIQRENGYDGYGASNAPARLASEQQAEEGQGAHN